MLKLKIKTKQHLLKIEYSKQTLKALDGLRLTVEALANLAHNTKNVITAGPHLAIATNTTNYRTVGIEFYDDPKSEYYPFAILGIKADKYSDEEFAAQKEKGQIEAIKIKLKDITNGLVTVENALNYKKDAAIPTRPAHTQKV